MRIGKVTLHNFGSFKGLHQVELDNRGLVFVLGNNLDEPKMESNGAGKSTLFDALDWALFGKVPRGDKAGSVVNREAGKDCWVVVELWEEGPTGQVDQPYHVFRYRDRAEGSGVKLFGPNEPDSIGNLTALDVKETDRLITEVLGMERDVFHAAVYRQQGDGFDFAEATDAERKKMLARIVPELAEVDRLQLRAKDTLGVSEGKLLELRGRSEQLKVTLMGFRETDLGRMEAAWAKQRAQRLQHAQAQHDAASAAYQQAEAEVARLPEFEAQRAAIPAPQTQNAWATEYDRRFAQWAQLSAHANALQTEKMRVEARQARMQSLQVGDCSECGQPITGEHLAQELAKLSFELAAASQAWQTALGEQDAYSNGPLREAAAYKEQEAAYNKAITDQHAQQVAGLDAEIRRLRTISVEALKVSCDQFAAAVVEIHMEKWMPRDNAASIQGLEAELATLGQEIEQAESIVEHWKWWVTALSNRGIKSYILDSRIGAMTEAANAWVASLTGGTFWVRFETQTPRANGELAEVFSIRIFRHEKDGGHTELSYKSLSGGEKKRVALGIDQGLSTLVASRASNPIGLYIIDESFRQHMDSSGREAIFELLQGLDRRSIFVVDHDKEMAGSFEHILRVQVENRTSSFPDEPEFEGSEPKDFLPPVYMGGAAVAA